MAYGEGTVYQRKDGKWVASVEAGYTPSGGRRRITRARATEAEAKRALRSIRREVLAEQQSTSVSPRTTLKAWIDTWAPAYKRVARPRTYSNDISLLGKWGIPTIGPQDRYRERHLAAPARRHQWPDPARPPPRHRAGRQPMGRRPPPGDAARRMPRPHLGPD